MAIDQEQHRFAMEALFCEEEIWDEGEGCEEERWDEGQGSHWIAQPEEEIKTKTNPHLHLLELLQQDAFYEHEEIDQLLLKEKTDITLSQIISNNQDKHPDLSLARHVAVKWMMRIGSHYRFFPSTTILAVGYYDRFLSSLVKHEREMPWMTQLAAVACLSLAAKMEEIEVPLLLDFQVDEMQDIFEAKAIQRMELVVLSAMQWRMNPITPVSFLDYMVRMLDLWLHQHKEFFQKCHLLLQSIAADHRYTRYIPSVLAAASIIRVAEEMDHRFDSHKLLMGVLRISEDEVVDCCNFIIDFSEEIQQNPRKRRKQENYFPGSPSGVAAEACFSGCGAMGSDSSNSFSSL